MSLSWEAPVQIAAGYHYRPIKPISIHFQAGLMTDPNSAVILSTMEALGTDELVVDMIEDAFQSGVVLELGTNYHFGSFYAGIFTQRVALKGKDTPVEIVEAVMGTDLTTYPTRRRTTNQPEVDLTLNSTLWQGGVLFGKDFSLPGKSSIFLEIAVSANLGSSSSLSAETRDLSALSQELDDYLSDIYTTYAYVGSLNIGWRYRL